MYSTRINQNGGGGSIGSCPLCPLLYKSGLGSNVVIFEHEYKLILSDLCIFIEALGLLYNDDGFI